MASISRLPVQGIWVDRAGNLWLTHSGDVRCIRKESLATANPVVEEVYRGHLMLFGIGEDRSGNIWIGGLQGVMRYDGKSVTAYRPAE